MPFWLMNQIKLDLLTKTISLLIYTKRAINWLAFLMRVGFISGKTMQVSHKLLYPPPTPPPIADASDHSCKYGDWNWNDF